MGITEGSFLERMEEMGFTARKTNADRIRSMTDEELAKMINGFESFALKCGGSWPTEKWLEWLRQEATND